MKYILIISLFFSYTATSQTATNTVDTSVLRKDSGQINVRAAIQWFYNKVTRPASGQVTQVTSKSTSVTLNNLSGRITMNASALAAGSEASFTLTNSFITATDVVIVNIQSGGTAGSYSVDVGSISNGSCTITISNLSTTSLSQAIVLNFLILK